MSKTLVNCPQCGKKTAWSKDNPHRPFCSERCKLIDLGAWANEEYQIAAGSENDFSTGEDADERKFTPTTH